MVEDASQDSFSFVLIYQQMLANYASVAGPCFLYKGAIGSSHFLEDVLVLSAKNSPKINHFLIVHLSVKQSTVSHRNLKYYKLQKLWPESSTLC